MVVQCGMGSEYPEAFLDLGECSFASRIWKLDLEPVVVLGLGLGVVVSGGGGGGGWVG